LGLLERVEVVDGLSRLRKGVGRPRERLWSRLRRREGELTYERARIEVTPPSLLKREKIINIK
jgi:hypothetical protein